MNPNDSSHTRLRLAKYLYSRGSNGLRGGGIFDPAVGVSSFHDAIELALVAVIDQFGGGRPKKGGFIEIWDAASGAAVQKQRERLPLRSDMIAMNEARTGFKHHGNRVTVADGEKFRLSTERVLTFIATEYFATEFADLSLASYVQIQEERRLLESAIKKLHSGDKPGALGECSASLELMRERSSRFYRHGWLIEYPTIGADPTAHALVRFTKNQIGHLTQYVRHVESLVMAGLYGVAPMDFMLLDSLLNPRDGATFDVTQVPNELVAKAIDILALYSIGMSDRHAELDNAFATNLRGERS